MKNGTLTTRRMIYSGTNGLKTEVSTQW